MSISNPVEPGFRFIFFDFVYFDNINTISKDKIDIFENIYPIFISL